LFVLAGRAHRVPHGDFDPIAALPAIRSLPDEGIFHRAGDARLDPDLQAAVFQTPGILVLSNPTPAVIEPAVKGLLENDLFFRRCQTAQAGKARERYDQRPHVISPFLFYRTAAGPFASFEKKASATIFDLQSNASSAVGWDNRLVKLLPELRFLRHASAR
jgi:hypothetical protein